MWKYIIILITVLTLNNSCRKDKGSNNDNGCTTKTYPYIPLDFVNYFGCYQEGSWWLYEDSTGLKDSCYVSSYSRSGGGTITNCNGNVLVGGEFIDLIISSTIEQKIEFRINVGTTNQNASMSAYNSIGEGIYEVNYDSGKYSLPAPPGYVSVDSFNSIYINNIRFNNVIVLLPMGMNTYLAPKIGIISKLFTDVHGNNRTMKLKSYHINY